jgi:type VI secretion system protein ImpC
MHAFEEYGWCTAIRGLEDDHGLVDGLPEVESPIDRPGVVPVPPVDFAVTESCEVGLTDLGLIPLCRVAATERVAFFNVPSLHQPMVVDDPKITTNLKLSAQVPYVLAASRIAHYLKVMMRDRVGKFSHASEIQNELSNWLAKYTLADDHATRERQSQFPLRAFDVQVREKPGRPGHLEAITQLQPHYQIEAPGVMLRLAVDLPDPEKTRR